MLSSHFLRSLFSVSFLVLASITSVLSNPVKRATVCNGHAELCGRSYGNTTFFVSHNAFAFSLLPAALARTQQVSVPTQLRLGVRALQGQTHMKDGKLHFCHTTCGLFDGGPVLDFLNKVKTFVDANPNEIITLILTNPEKVSLTDIWKPIFDQSGIASLAYAPTTPPVKRSDWPTLGQMIDSGKRVVVFMDNGADTSKVNFILPQFPMMWEDPFSPTNPAFPCRIDRTEGPLSNDDHLHLINHNLNVDIIPGDIGEVLISDFINAPKTNAMSSILAHATGCSSFSRGRAPNFVLLDHVDIGDGKKAVDRLNGF